MHVREGPPDPGGAGLGPGVLGGTAAALSGDQRASTTTATAPVVDRSRGAATASGRNAATSTCGDAAPAASGTDPLTVGGRQPTRP